MSPLLHLVRSESKTEVRSRPWLQNQISIDTFLSSHHNATICTSCLDTWQREQKSRNLYWQSWVCHAEETDVRGEMSVFMPKSDSHCISPIVILRNNNLWDVNTMKKNPCNRSCRCQSVWHEKNLNKDRKQLWDLDIYAEPHFNWHDSIVQLQYRPINLLRHWETAWINVPCASAHHHHR